MKNLFFILVLLGVLSGFYAGEPLEQEEIESYQTDGSSFHAEASEIPWNTTNEREPLYPSDGQLNEPGDTVADGKGMLTLMAASPVYDSFLLGGVDFIVKDVKLLKFIPTRSNGLNLESELEFIKVDVEIVNANPFSVQFNPVETIRVNGTEMPAENEFLLENMGGLMKAGETKTGSLGYLIEETGTLEVDIQSSNVSAKGNELISKAARFKVILNRQP
ncbi:hypothetical protein D1B31_20810 [Neobacillus notoginsengisoli]|uniref:DUF4352 domain-containing protein n=1 Tax=Neobacillus notoginsengisoli TaxID=1578198 RepID=A0A417YJW1_9BACI|nr:hypothetical protein [Neobacillus notoginsengisoli]RHW33359.1 hypothetical protein D1B31_20810 [Neobacillus notoginsengisoli]